MKTLTLPKESRLFIAVGILAEMLALQKISSLPDFSFIATILAFFCATYIGDFLTALFHFGFDYVWPDRFPIMGPISVEFRKHHDLPTLDPSAIVENLTYGCYSAIFFGVAAWISASVPPYQWQYFYSVNFLILSFWGFLFHQSHSYTHMGSKISAEEFNAAVGRISLLPKAQQKKEFAKLFQEAGIPKHVRFLQNCRLFLRPELHWRHHINFESNFSSLNGWSDPLTNLILGPIARHRKTAREKKEIVEHNAYSSPSLSPCKIK